MSSTDLGESQTPPVLISVLFLAPPRSRDASEVTQPPFFPDLMLNQIVAALTKDREEYRLSDFLFDHLLSVDTINFRHEVWRDLEDDDLRLHLAAFAKEMHEVRRRLAWAERARFVQERQGWHLDAAKRYCDAVEGLSIQLAATPLTSRGLLGLRVYLADYVSSAGFGSLSDETRALKEELSNVRYCINVRGSRVRVLRYDGEADYGAEIEETFERFQQGAVSDYLHSYADWPNMNHVQSSIADRVALLYEDVFSSLRSFCEERKVFLDETVSSFDRELQFYLAYLDLIGPLRARGLSFCLPDVRDDSKEVFAEDTFDLALARKLAAQQTTVVPNDFHLEGAERIVIVSGPNQGGKTTFARTIGQLHYLACVGFPVPGRRARLARYDELYTHFGKEEDASYESGKLEEDLLRIRDVLSRATTNSLIIMNEIFSSTTAHDALVLGTKVIEKAMELDLLCVTVTFVDELTLLGPSIVSMTSTVNPDDPVERTYKVVRRPADGLAYALAIAEKYGLTYGQLRGRIVS